MRPAVLIFAGLAVGASLVVVLPSSWLLSAPEPAQEGEVWACPMLCARLDHPGRCPVCGMELERIAGGGDRVVLSADQATVIGLRRHRVEPRALARSITTPGVVETALGEAAGTLNARTFSVKIELFDTDLASVAVGQPAEVSFDLQPGKKYKGVVSSVAANIKPETRTTTGWIAVDKQESRIPNGALAMVSIRAALGADGPAVSLAGRYTCRLHPQIHADAQGACPVCGLALSIDPTAAAGVEDGPRLIAVPRDAILSTGERHVVYVETSSGTFQLREVRVGARAGEWIQIAGGLTEGEIVAEKGGFLLDSHLQLSGRASVIAR